MLLEIPFNGLSAREADNRIPFSQALKADDCILDSDTVARRPGLRMALQGAVVNAGNAQHMGRFRPSATSARTVVVVSGEVFVITDPSTELLSNGAATSLGTPTGWNSTAKISGAQLGTCYYLGTDQSGVAMVRITWTSTATYALESLEAIPAPARPLGAVSSTLSWNLFSSLTPVYTGTIIKQTNSATGFTNMDSAWIGFSATNNGNDDPLQNTAVAFDITTPVVGTNFDWMAVTISPHDEGGSVGNRRVTVQVSSDNSAFYNVGSIWDVPPAGGSPNVLFCDLRQLLPAVRASIRYFKFLVEGISGGKFILYGYCFLPRMFQPNPPSLSVDFFNSATGQMSAMSAEAKTSGGQVLTVQKGTVAPYPDSYMTSNNPVKTGASADIFNTTNPRVFNRAVGMAMPDPNDVGGTITISGTTSAYTGTLTVRLWLVTGNGQRLITTVDKAASTAYSFTFGYSDGVLANQDYRPGGVGPRCACLGAHAQRLIAMYQNRVYISSYVPTSANLNAGGGVSVNPFPQWPDIALEDSDGWSFDIAPAPTEQGLVVDGRGDSVYLVTSEAWYSMSDLTPNSPPFMIYRRGAMGGQSGLFAEDRFFIDSWDGVFQGVNRTNPSELTESIRRLYKDWLLPDGNACIGYHGDERALYVCQDTRLLRYRFPTHSQPGKWTRGTLSKNVRFLVGWQDSPDLLSDHIAVYFLDTFTAADGVLLDNHTSDSGHTWTAHPGSGGGIASITSNRLRKDNIANALLYFVTGAPSSADYEVRGDFYVADKAWTGELELWARMRTTGTGQGYYVALTSNGSAQNWILYKDVNGVATSLATAVATVANGSTYTVRLRVNGTALTVYVDGVSTLTATDSDITAAGRAGLYINGAQTDTTGFHLASFDTYALASSTFNASGKPQLWALTDDRYIGRVQSDASRDFLVNENLTTGDALPDWVYSTGFDLTPSPSVVKGLLIDADGPVKVTTAKTVLGTVPAQAREFDVTVPMDADERWIPAASDFDAMKFRLEFTGSPSVELRRAMFERDLISKKGG